ncbi:Hypothetical protein, putative [Bodo saltans]|uniref:Uncharacterized protein n=1 Tax=Bodo saltans TaxID=75058 RepID=A0A0S4KL18_BODSA|nr:Hypothetical protein, putative [Bodo saltans]|eukprot:CUI14309.1 Hypothetical protein, putative [Bodo saltans]
MQQLYGTLSANLASRFRSSFPEQSDDPSSSSLGPPSQERLALECGAYLCEAVVSMYCPSASSLSTSVLAPQLSSSSSTSTFFLRLGGFVVAAEAALRWRGPASPSTARHQVDDASTARNSSRGSALDPAECMAATMARYWWDATVLLVDRNTGDHHPSSPPTTGATFGKHTALSSSSIASIHACSELLMDAVSSSTGGAFHVKPLAQFLERWSEALLMHLNRLTVEMVNVTKTERQQQQAASLDESTTAATTTSLKQVESLVRCFFAQRQSSEKAAFTSRCWHAVLSCVCAASQYSLKAPSSSAPPLPAEPRATLHLAVGVVNAYLCSCSTTTDDAFFGCSGRYEQSNKLRDLVQWVIVSDPLTFFPSMIMDGLALCCCHTGASSLSAAAAVATRSLLALLSNLVQDTTFLTRLVDPLTQNASTASQVSQDCKVAAQSYVVHLVQLELYAKKMKSDIIGRDFQLALLQTILLQHEGEAAATASSSGVNKLTAVDLEVFALQWLEHTQRRLAACTAGSQTDHKDSIDDMERMLSIEVSLLNAARRALSVAATENGGLTLPQGIFLKWRRSLTQWADSFVIDQEVLHSWPNCGDDEDAVLHVFVLQSELSLFPRAMGSEASGFTSRCKIPAAILAESASPASVHSSTSTPLKGAVKTVQEHWSGAGGTGPRRNIAWCPAATTVTIVIDGWLTCILTTNQLDLLDYVLRQQHSSTTTTALHTAVESVASRTKLLQDYASANSSTAAASSTKGISPAEMERTLRSLAHVFAALRRGALPASLSSFLHVGRSAAVVDVSLLPQLISLCDAASSSAQRGTGTHKPQLSSKKGQNAAPSGEPLRAEAFVCRTAKRAGPSGLRVVAHVSEYIDFVRRQWVLLPNHISSEALNKRLLSDVVLAVLREQQDDSSAERVAREELAAAQVSLISKGYLSSSDPSAHVTSPSTTEATISCTVLFVAT